MPNGISKNWESLSESEKRWMDFDRYLSETGQSEKKTEMSPEDEAELKKITSKKYYEESNTKGIQVDRIMGKILAGKGTLQDFMNLYVGTAKLISKFEERTITNEFTDPVINFVQDRVPLMKGASLYNVAGERYLKGCNLKFNADGYVVLTDTEKKDLFDIKKAFDNNLSEKDKQLLASGWQDLRKESFQIHSKTVYSNLNPAGVYDTLDKEKRTTEFMKDHMISHPEFKAKTEEELRSERESLNNNRLSGAKKALFNDMKEAGEGIKTLKEACKAMKSHTPISLFNSKAYDNMEKAFNNYIKAYDNLMGGRTIDGKSARENPEAIEPSDLKTLKELQDKMQKAARDYTEAKRVQKGGGIEKHRTKQGEDRLAMADAIANFNLITGKEEALKNDSVVKEAGKGKTKRVNLSTLEGKERGRTKLDHHKRVLKSQDQAQKSKSNTNVM